MKKHTSALVYVAITFIMLVGVQQLGEKVENSKDRYAIFVSRGLDIITYCTCLKRFIELTQAEAEISLDTF